jgi:hypothetical protein
LLSLDIQKVDAEVLAALIKYIRRELHALDAQPFGDLMNGEIKWGPPLTLDY